MNKKSLIFLTFFCTTIFYGQNFNKTQQEKDLELRNKIENTNPKSVLDGNIDQFIEEGIKNR